METSQILTIFNQSVNEDFSYYGFNFATGSISGDAGSISGKARDGAAGEIMLNFERYQLCIILVCICILYKIHTDKFRDKIDALESFNLKLTNQIESIKNEMILNNHKNLKIHNDITKNLKEIEEKFQENKEQEENLIIYTYSQLKTKVNISTTEEINDYYDFLIKYYPEFNTYVKTLVNTNKIECIKLYSRGFYYFNYILYKLNLEIKQTINLHLDNNIDIYDNSRFIFTDRKQNKLYDIYNHNTSFAGNTLYDKMEITSSSKLFVTSSEKPNYEYILTYKIIE